MSEFDANTLLQNLGISTEEQDRAVIPSEGIDFGAGSIIAPWTAGIYYWFLTKEDYIQYNKDAKDDESLTPVAVPDIRSSKGDSGWFDMYYSSYDVALKTYYALDPDAEDSGYKPKVYWVFTTPTAQVMNSKDLDKMIAGFGDQIVLAVRVMALRRGSQKYPLKERHEFGLLGLPCAVAAIADVFGFQHTGYSLEELTKENAKDDFDDEFFDALCGPTTGDYTESTLFQRRAALWKSLGEDNPKASAMIGAKTASGKPNRNATTSEKLSACLGIAEGRWTKPLYARVMTVPNPVAADNGEHYSLPVLGEIFRTEAEAREAAQADLGEDGQVVSSHPLVIGGWAGSEPSDVINYLTQNKIVPLSDEVLAVAPPPKRDAQHAARMELVSASYLCADEQNPTDGEWDVLVEWDTYIREQA